MNINDQNVIICRQGIIQSLQAIHCQIHGIARFAQPLGQELMDTAVIFNDQNPHRPSIYRLIV